MLSMHVAYRSKNVNVTWHVPFKANFEFIYDREINMHFSDAKYRPVKEEGEEDKEMDPRGHETGSPGGGGNRRSRRRRRQACSLCGRQ